MIALCWDCNSRMSTLIFPVDSWAMNFARYYLTVPSFCQMGLATSFELKKWRLNLIFTCIPCTYLGCGIEEPWSLILLSSQCTLSPFTLPDPFLFCLAWFCGLFASGDCWLWSSLSFLFQRKLLMWSAWVGSLVSVDSMPWAVFE